MKQLRLAIIVIGLGVAGTAAAQNRAMHDLTAPGGPGTSPAVCEFCHSPHTGEPAPALWSRELSGVTYKLYESATLQAVPKQPTGSSRLCLSCHDGTIALATTPLNVGGRSASKVTGRAILGTDLSDDHPISFNYDAALTARNRELADPGLLPRAVVLDEDGQLQCTTCHDPHQGPFAKSLVVDERFSQLCTTCHRMEGWASSAHATSPATWTGAGENPWPNRQAKTVAENGCQSCHRMHAAGHPQWLLTFAEEDKNCVACHNGSVAAKDVERDFKKFSAHPISRTAWVHTPTEDPLVMSRHVTCADCHDPHASRAAKGAVGAFSATVGRLKGISTSGSRVAEARFEYEMCYACHGVGEQARAAMTRVDPVTNVRSELDPANPSYHPVVGPGRNPNVAGLEPGFSPASVIRCSDCHSSDSGRTPNGSKGPHGSIYEPILEREYQVGDPAPESFQSYALCYKCHNRTSLMTDGNGFPHRRHVVEGQASCAVCHDAHGSRRNTRLINFMVSARTGNRVVSPSSAGRLEFVDFGHGRGQCSLTCHRADHNARNYP